MTDRRAQPRYDVVGALWGVLELREEAQIRNVSATGALLESSFPAALDAAQTLRLLVDGHGVAVEARVRHVRAEADGRMEPCYAIGVEFVAPPTPVLQAIEQLTGRSASDADTEAS
jgi:hypothetical protein